MDCVDSDIFCVLCVPMARLSRRLCPLTRGPRRHSRDKTTPPLDSENALFEHFSTLDRTFAVRDDYSFWAHHDCHPAAGKPMWFCRESSARVHHIFFDDNIHWDAHDGIVAVRARESPAHSWHAVSGEDRLAYIGSMLVQAQILDAIRDEDYFIKRVRALRSRTRVPQFARICQDSQGRTQVVECEAEFDKVRHTLPI